MKGELRRTQNRVRRAGTDAVEGSDVRVSSSAAAARADRPRGAGVPKDAARHRCRWTALLDRRGRMPPRPIGWPSRAAAGCSTAGRPTPPTASPGEPRRPRQSADWLILQSQEGRREAGFWRDASGGLRKRQYDARVIRVNEIVNRGFALRSSWKRLRFPNSFRSEAAAGRPQRKEPSASPRALQSLC